MALALPDEVFVERNDLAYFEDRWVQKGTNAREFLIKKDMEDIPVLRALHRDKISESRIMSATSVGNYLRLLGERMGYEESLTCYTFRRGFGNEVEGKCRGDVFESLLIMVSQARCPDMCSKRQCLIWTTTSSKPICLPSSMLTRKAS